MCSLQTAKCGRNRQNVHLRGPNPQTLWPCENSRVRSLTHSARGIVRWRTGWDRSISDRAVGRQNGENRQNEHLGAPSPRMVPPGERCPIRTLALCARGIVRQWYDNDREVNELARGRKLLKVGKMKFWGALTPNRHDLDKTPGYGYWRRRSQVSFGGGTAAIGR